MAAGPDQDGLEAWIRQVAARTGLPLTDERVRALAAAAGPLLASVEALRSPGLKDAEPAATFRHRRQG